VRLWAVVVVALVGCGGGGTALDGTIPCGTTTCQSGQLCEAFPVVVPDAGVVTQSGCDTVPAGCEVVDCDGAACPHCIVDLCTLCEGTNYNCAAVHVKQRTLQCPGG